MPRPLRLDFPGAHFHVTARGVARQEIFLDPSDRRCYLKVLHTACDRYGGICHAYCLMGNHYHLLLESADGRLSSVMQHLNGSFGRWFNRRRQRCGHLFQGRFKTSLIDKDGYFLEVIRYIELNPCRAKIVSHPGEWAWSSFRPRVGLSRIPPPLSVARALEFFGSGPQAQKLYERFVLDGLSDEKIAPMLRQETIVGSPQFIRQHAERARRLAKRQKVPRSQRYADRPDLTELLVGSGADRRARAVQAVLQHGYSMSEVAHRLGVHYTTVSRWVRRADCDYS
jgi:REP element-mobilizing transposase RayT